MQSTPFNMGVQQEWGANMKADKEMHEHNKNGYDACS